MNVLNLWMKVLFSPKEGFSQLEEKTKIALPLLLLLLIVIIATAITLPVMTSQELLDSQINMTMNMLEKRGAELTDDQKAGIVENQTKQAAPLFRTLSALIGGLIGFLLSILFSSFYLFLLGKIAGGEAKYGFFLRVLVFASLVPVLGTLIKSIMLILSNWKLLLGNVVTYQDFSAALMSNTSLATFFSPKLIGFLGFLSLDFLTDIFNILYFILIYFGLTSALKMSRNRALVTTLLFALGVGIISVGMKIFPTLFF